MSATIDVPKGLDTLTKEESALMERMRADDAGDPGGSPDLAPEPVAKTLPVAPAQKTQQPAPEQNIADDPEPDEDEIDLETGERQPNRSKTVPHQQFHAANEKRKAAETALAEERTKFATEQARLQERVNLIVAAAQSATAPAPAVPVVEEPLPDVNTDPVGHFKVAYERTQKQVDTLKSMFDGSQEQQRQAAQVQQLRNWGADQERAFSAAEPTYNAAMEHLRQSRSAELNAIGITDPNQQAQILGQDISAIAAKARQDGANFAERLYGLATARGYQKPADPAALAALSPAAIPSIELPAAAIPAIAARQQAGRENSLTIGTAGTAPPAKLSVDKIANMTEGEFSALLKRMDGNPAALRNLMGD